MQLEYTLLHHGTALGSYCQSLPILVFCKEIGVTSPALVLLERACCMCTKHG